MTDKATLLSDKLDDTFKIFKSLALRSYRKSWQCRRLMSFWGNLFIFCSIFSVASYVKDYSGPFIKIGDGSILPSVFGASTLIFLLLSVIHYWYLTNATSSFEYKDDMSLKEKATDYLSWPFFIIIIGLCLFQENVTYLYILTASSLAISVIVYRHVRFYGYTRGWSRSRTVCLKLNWLRFRLKYGELSDLQEINELSKIVNDEFDERHIDIITDLNFFGDALTEFLKKKVNK